MKKILVFLTVLFIQATFAKANDIYTLPAGVIHCNVGQCKIGYKIGEYEISGTPGGGTTPAPAGEYVLHYAFSQNSLAQNMSVVGGAYSLNGCKKISSYITIHRIRKMTDKDQLVPYTEVEKPVVWMGAREIPFVDGVSDIAVGTVDEIKFVIQGS